LKSIEKSRTASSQHFHVNARLGMKRIENGLDEALSSTRIHDQAFGCERMREEAKKKAGQGERKYYAQA